MECRCWLVERISFNRQSRRMWPWMATTTTIKMTIITIIPTITIITIKIITRNIAITIAIITIITVIITITITITIITIIPTTR